jgi:hypothetical protein
LLEQEASRQHENSDRCREQNADRDDDRREHNQGAHPLPQTDVGLAADCRPFDTATNQPEDSERVHDDGVVVVFIEAERGNEIVVRKQRTPGAATPLRRGRLKRPRQRSAAVEDSRHKDEHEHDE